MTSLAEFFQAFHVYAYENALTASARTLYYTILGEFNATFWKRSELSKSVRDVTALGGFKASSTVQKAKSELCTENILKISKGKHGDVYQLVEPSQWRKFSSSKLSGQLVDSKCTDSGQLVDTKCTLSGQLVDTLENPNYARVKDREDTKDLKTLSSERAREEVRPPNQQHPTNSQAVLDLWRQFGGYGEGFALIDLENRYGTQALIDAIKTAGAENRNIRGLHYGFFKTVFERILKGGSPRGKIIPIPARSDLDDAWESERANSFFG